MDINQTVKKNYHVVKADKKQIEFLYETRWKSSNTTKEEQKNRIIFLAFDEIENILGVLTAMETPVPEPLYGINWFILSINIQMEYRRQGIASALIKEAVVHAKQENVMCFYGSADPTLQAHMLYFKQNFCFLRYGKICDDYNKPLEYGNYHHMFFNRLDKLNKSIKKQEKYRIINTDKESLDWIFNEYVIKTSPQAAEFYRDKKEEIFGFTAIDDDNKILGFITAREDEMYAPLENIQWWIPYIFIYPEFRRQGIGTNLVQELIKSAKKSNVMQLTSTFKNEDATEFWYDNNFDIYFWGQNSDGTRTVSAAMRIM